MRFLELEVLRQQIGEFSETLAGNNRCSMLEINNFFKVSKSTSIVKVVVCITILLLKRDVVKHKLASLRREGLSGDAIGMFIFFGSKKVLFRSGLNWFLLDHKQRIISRETTIHINSIIILFSNVNRSSVENIFGEQRTRV